MMSFIPKDIKSGIILRGRFESKELKEQIIVPSEVVENLLQTIFRIKKIFDMVFALIGIATLIIILLIVTPSIVESTDELLTMFTIGSSKYKTVEIIGFELVIILSLSLSVALLFYWITGFYIETFIRQFII